MCVCVCGMFWPVLHLSSQWQHFKFRRACTTARTPDLSTSTPPTRRRQCFRFSGTRTKRRFRVIWPVYVFWRFARFAARTAWCSERAVQPRWTRSTHLTPFFWPPGMSVCVLCFDWFCHHFGSSAHSFAPQQISSFLGASAEIQEQHDLLYQGLKSLILLLCKTRPARTCPRRTALLQQAHGGPPDCLVRLLPLTLGYFFGH